MSDDIVGNLADLPRNEDGTVTIPTAGIWQYGRPESDPEKPHAFVSISFATMGHPLSYRGPCKVCTRGSAHHIHDEV